MVVCGGSGCVVLQPAQPGGETSVPVPPDPAPTAATTCHAQCGRGDIPSAEETH